MHKPYSDYKPHFSTIQFLPAAVQLLSDLAVWHHGQGQFDQSTKVARLANQLHRRTDPLHQFADLAEQAAAIATDYGRRALDRDYWLLHKFYSEQTHDQ